MERISTLEAEIAELKKNLHRKEEELSKLRRESSPDPESTSSSCEAAIHQQNKLPKWAIERYSRQILLPEIGVLGQLKLCRAKVLIVGAGGLGCPAALYLAGAGVGEIGIVDYDTVDLTNLHRQVLHNERDQGINKVDSAAHSLKSINSHVKIMPYNLQLDSSNALEIVSKYDLVLDCTDNVPTRYLLNDACVLTKRPLISGSALKLEGQLTIYGYRQTHDGDNINTGPCYRCLFRNPPPPETVGSCSANGVAGPVPGIIGALQALEAMKYIVGQPKDKLLVGRMLIFDGDDMTFRTVKLRNKSPECAVCSSKPTITRLIDYELFCRSQAKEKDLDLRILLPEYRIAPKDLASVLNKRHLLVDVRQQHEFHMCNIDGSVNYPIDILKGEHFDRLMKEIRIHRDVTFICRRGNDSQIIARRVLDVLNQENIDGTPHTKVRDLIGGLHAWAKDVDTDFPVY